MREEDDLQAGAFDGEVAQVVAALFVDGPPEAGGDAGVVPVEDVAVDQGADGGGDAEGAFWGKSVAKSEECRFLEGRCSRGGVGICGGQLENLQECEADLQLVETV